MHLPDAHADFIYAVAAEEFGFVFCIIILGLFAFLVLRTISRMLNENNFFIVIAVSGLVIELGVQAMINISSTLGLIPTRSEEHTSELQSLMRIPYAVFCLTKKHKKNYSTTQYSNKKKKRKNTT